MEWHIFDTVAASFLALLGFLMDVQSLRLGFRQINTGRKTSSVKIWPFALYVAAALIADVDWVQKVAAITAGALFHAFSTVGIRAFRRI